MYDLRPDLQRLIGIDILTMWYGARAIYRVPISPLNQRRLSDLIVALRLPEPQTKEESTKIRSKIIDGITSGRLIGDLPSAAANAKAWNDLINLENILVSHDKKWYSCRLKGDIR